MTSTPSSLRSGARTDIHRPGAIDPTAYEFVAFGYLKVDDIGSAMFLQAQRELLREHTAASGGAYASHAHGGNCQLCGNANCVYTAYFHHAPTNTYLRTGLDCADKLQLAYDEGSADRFRKQVKAAREQAAGKRKARAVLSDLGLSTAWTVYAGEPRRDRDGETIADMVGKLVRYGSLSDKQVSFLRSLVAREESRPEIEAAREAERALAAPVPVSPERLVVRATVDAVQKADFDRGVFYDRLFVRHETGWRVMGGLPSALRGVSRGDVVEFCAAVTPSDRDPKFGFFKRPTRCRVVTAAPERAAA